MENLESALQKNDNDEVLDYKERLALILDVYLTSTLLKELLYENIVCLVTRELKEQEEEYKQLYYNNY